MSSTALKIFAAVSVIAAIVLAGLGYRMSRDYAQKSEQAQQQVRQQAAEQALAVVALKPLAAYQPIARDAVALVPVSVKPADPYSSIDEVVGKQPLVDIDAGAPVTHRYFREGNILARAIPPGYQAVSIAVNDVLAVGGFLRPGDIVDVLIFLRGTDATAQPQSRVLLEKVRVLAYLEQIVDRPVGVANDPNDPNNSQRQQQQRTAVLAIADADTTKLMLGSSLGDLRLALHGQNDAGTAGSDTGASGDAVVAGTASSPAPSAAPATTLATGDTGAAAPAKPLPPRKLRPEKVITSAELARIAAPDGVPRARVEIIRGNDISSVSVK